MNGAALRTEQTSKIDTMRKAAKPGDNKSMPPQPSTAPGAARWFIPGVGGAETSNFLVYDCVDALFLTIIGTIGGARSVSGVVTVWADGILRKVAGWVSIPDPTTLGRIFRTFAERQVYQLELLNHRLRGRFWRKALRSGASTIAMRPCRVIDVDSTEKTAYGTQQGVQKGYNPFRRGKASYHPLLAFCAETKEILQGWLRSGDAYTGNGVVEFTRQLLAHLPNFR
jgi:hypothetical protein